MWSGLNKWSNLCTSFFPLPDRTNNELMPNFFAGIISFSNYDNIWDFGTGFLQLNPSKDAKIKFKQSNLIHEGTDFDDPSSKNLRLTAWALSDLAVDAMMIYF